MAPVLNKQKQLICQKPHEVSLVQGLIARIQASDMFDSKKSQKYSRSLAGRKDEPPEQAFVLHCPKPVCSIHVRIVDVRDIFAISAFLDTNPAPLDKENFRFILYSLLRDKAVPRRASPPVSLSILPSTDFDVLFDRAKIVADAVNELSVIFNTKKNNPGMQILFAARPLFEIFDAMEQLQLDKNQPHKELIVRGMEAVAPIKDEILRAMDAFGPWLKQALGVISDR